MTDTCPGVPPAVQDFFLPRRCGWMHRGLFSGGLPVRPTTGDLGPVIDAVADIVDAAGGVEHSRAQLARVVVAAKMEFDALHSDSLPAPDHWAGVNTPAVYHEFSNAVAWTRAVADRYGDRLQPAVRHDPFLWTDLQKIRSTVAEQFEDARLLAGVSLHRFTPPFPAAPAWVENGTLVYPVPVTPLNREDYRKNRLEPGRHVVSVVDNLWTATEKFVDQLLDLFYPTKAGDADGG